MSDGELMGQIHSLQGPDPDVPANQDDESAGATGAENVDEVQEYMRSHGAIPPRQTIIPDFFPPRGATTSSPPQKKVRTDAGVWLSSENPAGKEEDGYGWEVLSGGGKDRKSTRRSTSKWTARSLRYRWTRT